MSSHSPSSAAADPQEPLASWQRNLHCAKASWSISRSPTALADEPRFAILLFSFMLISISIAYPIFLYDDDIGSYPTGIQFSYILNASIIFCGLAAAALLRAVALFIINLFHWVFYVVAVREQLILQWDAAFTNYDLLQKALLLLLLYLLVFHCFYFAFPARARRPSNFSYNLCSNIFLTIICLGTLCVSLLFIGLFGGSIFTSREGFGSAMAALFPSWLQLILNNFLFPLCFILPFLVLVGLISHRRPLGIVYVIALISVICGFILINPVATQRAIFGALMIGAAGLVIGPRRLLPVSSMVLIAMMVAPVFNILRSEYHRAAGFEFDLSGFFSSWDFDAFSNMLYAILYADTIGWLNGRNMLSVLFFFVPDDIWSGKLPPTGVLVMDAVGRTYRSFWPKLTSSPIPGEGYLAFGVFGVVLLTSIYAVAFRWLDAAPRGLRLRERVLSPHVCCLAFAIVLVFYLARGTLLGTVPNTAGMMVATMLSSWLIRRRSGTSHPDA